MCIWQIFKKKNKSKELSYSEFESWLDKALDVDISDDVVAFCFNLYEDSDFNWTMELIGTNSFDTANNDWACDEVFTTRENPLIRRQESEWPIILDLSQRFIKQYIEQGKNKQTLKGRKGLAVGFVEGDLVLL